MKVKRFINNVLLALLCVLSYTNTGAASSERTGARANTGEHSLAARIKFPELKGDTTAILRCAARVKDNGELKDNGCYVESPADQLFVTEISKAARKAKLSPAQSNGTRVSVYFQYRVEFVKKGEDQTVTVYENPGVQENIDAYGAAHVAAQRTIGREEWQKVCPKRAEYLVWLKGHVAPDGQQSSLSLTHGSGLMPTPRCQQAILDSVSQSLFFPALAEGEPVPSTYVEPFGN